MKLGREMGDGRANGEGRLHNGCCTGQVADGCGQRAAITLTFQFHDSEANTNSQGEGHAFAENKLYQDPDEFSLLLHEGEKQKQTGVQCLIQYQSSARGRNGVGTQEGHPD